MTTSPTKNGSSRSTATITIVNETTAMTADLSEIQPGRFSPVGLLIWAGAASGAKLTMLVSPPPILEHSDRSKHNSACGNEQPGIRDA